ncbi:hypothetical protein GE21DRAFT_9944 [Neurospora crassa]|uniref:Uncharacterized protein n=1 Tax=Neurospora crassa (strain ATCC 24698 / 74-OR23-1A / CBS 708.71 / DSM 1257 / FGSC 987) TaxID=367110 RepID=Q7S281_NEUCR|nr:hypothetical protein NCU09411 [Neurospora crassa OR74A]EAA29518.2 hypothetical protein NCU09411 [Neurospora crassa OR74A]KHE85668.1 hypothetical protein GE21DRAFT_9944 [Neurospora crassa]|eukprot:XP_958754.2 hypothetical protein NCU09411 [Neurospora crassa OR74A]
MNSTIVSPYPQTPSRTYLRRSTSTIGSFATALSYLTPTDDDISLRRSSSSDIPTVPAPDHSLTAPPSSPPSETDTDTQGVDSFILMAFNADDIEYGPKTLDDFLRGDNPVQRAINFYRYVQMKKFPLCLSVVKATLSMALYGYAMIWFVELRDVWRKLDLDDHESREGWFVWLYLINAFFFIVTLYRFIRAISRLHGAPYEKHTFLDVGEAFDPFIPGRTNVYIYFIFSSAAVIAHVSSSIGIALWVKDWMAGGPATTNPHRDIIFTSVMAPDGTRRPVAIPVRLFLTTLTTTFCLCTNSTSFIIHTTVMATTFTQPTRRIIMGIIYTTTMPTAFAQPMMYTIMNTTTLTFGKAFLVDELGRFLYLRTFR